MTDCINQQDLDQYEGTRYKCTSTQRDNRCKCLARGICHWSAGADETGHFCRYKTCSDVVQNSDCTDLGGTKEICKWVDNKCKVRKTHYDHRYNLIVAALVFAVIGGVIAVVYAPFMLPSEPLLKSIWTVLFTRGNVNMNIYNGIMWVVALITFALLCGAVATDDERDPLPITSVTLSGIAFVVYCIWVYDTHDKDESDTEFITPRGVYLVMNLIILALLSASLSERPMQDTTKYEDD